VAVKGPDPDARAPGDLLERGIRSLFGEDLTAGREQLRAVPGRITTEVAHHLKITKTEAASVFASRLVVAAAAAGEDERREQDESYRQNGDMPHATSFHQG
jgi:hypothetical protein